ncbi:MAG: hypothetical protein OQK82_01765 [Candidatus Pacearchaeota archaeon]|nr:hypothetical protein [Candidatus Pacearchaeota archaeon]
MNLKEFFMPSWKKFWIVVGLFLLSRISIYGVYFLGYSGFPDFILYIFSFIYYPLDPLALISYFFFGAEFYRTFVRTPISYPIIILYHYLLACLIIFFYKKFKNRKS